MKTSRRQLDYQTSKRGKCVSRTKKLPLVIAQETQQCTEHPTQIRGFVRTWNAITSPESPTWLRKELQSGRRLCMRALSSRPETQETKNTYTLFINGGRAVEPWAEFTKTRLRRHRKKHGVEVKHPLLCTIVHTKTACWTKRGTNWIL